MPDEIEKKFLIAGGTNVKELIKPFKTTNIVQAYLEVGDTERRVRSKGDKYFYTIKRKKPDSNGLVRGEEEREITESEFKTGLQKHIGNVINKTRTKIPLANDLFAELDIFKDDLDGLVTVEVEFPDEKMVKDFNQPEWFGLDVTSDKRYKNQTLAIDGLPTKSIDE